MLVNVSRYVHVLGDTLYGAVNPHLYDTKGSPASGGGIYLLTVGTEKERGVGGRESVPEERRNNALITFLQDVQFVFMCASR